MAKIKIHELAKEFGVQSKEVIAFLQSKGIEAKAAQSAVEDDAAGLVRKHFGSGAPKPAAEEKESKAAPKAKESTKTAETKEVVNTDTKEAGKPVENKETVKAAENKEAGKENAEAPKKKKTIIFVSNPQNSRVPGQPSGRNNQGQGNRGGMNGNQGQNQRNKQNVRSGQPAPVRPIKPLTPPSPTPSVQMVPSRQPQKAAPKAEPAREEKLQSQTDNTAAAGTAAPKPAVERPATDRTAAERQADRPVQANVADRPSYGNRDNRNGQGGDRPYGNRDNRNGQSGDRPYGNRDNRNGQGGDRPSFGNRDNRNGAGRDGGFRKPGQGGSKGFAPETTAKDAEKHRDEEKRRISQEKDKRSRKDFMYEEEEPLKNKPGRFIKPEKKKEEATEEAIKVIVLPETITIKDLADKMKVQSSAIIKKLFLEGKMVTVNQEISYEEAENIAMEYDILCEKEVKVDVIEELLKEDDENDENLVSRPPVICVMGHVDHGKTSLLDAIRKTNVTDREAGGITQHIGAYTVSVNDRKITFLDTPGHEAFTAMRMRGANATDIAILVVAADDGVMPQTVEAINHAKAAGIEIIVAVNKIDKPNANVDRVKQELTEYELIPVDWGGTTEFVPVSAKSGEGIDDLLETILLTADILELKANPNRKARGLVIEAELDKGRGPVATILVQKGTLHVGDFISAGASHGKVRAMIDDKGRRVKEAGPSTPVEILGLNDVPSAGEVFLAHDNDKTAKSFADTYLEQNKEKKLEETKSKMSLDDLFSQIQEGNLKELNLIVKADVQGSVEAVKQSLLKLSNEEVVVKCIHGGVGAINESDVMLASASSAIIIGFNVRPDATAKATAEREGVDIRLYKVIYQAIEDIEAAMKGMLDPVFEEKVIGHAEVRQIFKASAVGNIAGSYVQDGVFQRGCKVRITRGGEQIYEGELASLKRFKDDVKEVKAGYECGLVFDGFDKMQELDIVEAYIMVEVPRQ